MTPTPKPWSQSARPWSISDTMPLAKAKALGGVKIWNSGATKPATAPEHFETSGAAFPLILGWIVAFGVVLAKKS